MLRIRYSKETSNYFFDNSSLVSVLQEAVEGLVFTDGIPTEGFHYTDPNGRHVWGIYDHTVVYVIDGRIIYIETVMPAN